MVELSRQKKISLKRGREFYDVFILLYQLLVGGGIEKTKHRIHWLRAWGISIQDSGCGWVESDPPLVVFH